MLDKIVGDLLDKGQAVMVGEWLGCEHRAGSFQGTGPNAKVRHTDAVTHAVLCGNKAYNIVQRVTTQGEGQTAHVDAALKRGVKVAVAVSAMQWAEGTVKISASAVVPIGTGKAA
jgi:hypothetical protein